MSVSSRCAPALVSVALTVIVALAASGPAAAAPDASVTAGAQIPSGAFDFVSNANASCTHHVATTGDDANSGTSVSLPWRTPAKAMASLRAGQTVCVHAGTYDVGTLDPSASGTAAQPITVMAAP